MFGVLRRAQTLVTELYMTKTEFTAAREELFLSTITDLTKVSMTYSLVASIVNGSTTLVSSQYITVAA